MTTNSSKIIKKCQCLKFCGRSGGTIVPCGQSECYRIDGKCRLELAGLIKSNRHTLDAFLEAIMRDCGPLTPVGVRAIAQDRFGDVIALLLYILAAQKLRAALIVRQGKREEICHNSPF